MSKAVGISSLPLSGKRCVVTGGARGIGAAVAAELVRRGAIVSVGDIELLHAEKPQADTDKIRSYRLDVTKEKSVAAFFRDASAGMGGIDLLVNNAGINRPGPTRSMEFGDWCHVIDVNLSGAWLCAREAERHMPDGAAIVNVASIHAMVGSALHGGAAYAASKAGLVGLTRSLAVEWAARRIRVNAVAPTYVETDLTRDRLSDPEYFAAMHSRQPLPTQADERDVAGAVCFLASDDARMVTGAVLPVDGGWLAA